MTKPACFILTPQIAGRAALKAFKEGRLGFQIGATACRYRYDDPDLPNCGCAIGVGIPDGVIKDLAELGGAIASSAFTSILPERSNHLFQLMALQEYHDEIICGFINEPKYDPSEAVQWFLSYATKLANEAA